MLKIEKSENTCKVELFQVNKLNTLFSDLVRDQLKELVQEPGVEILFNLEGIRFIDSSGFGVLTDISKLARNSGSQFRLCNITDEVSELVNLLGLEGKLDFGTLKSNGERILMELD